MDTKTNQLETLSKLEDLDQSECREVMSDYDSFKNRVQLKTSVRTFVAHLRNAETSHVKKNYTREKQSLTHAMDITHSDHITDGDMRNEELRDYITGTVLTSEKIGARLNELGSALNQK